MLENLLYFLVTSLFCLLWGMPIIYWFDPKTKRDNEYNLEQLIFSFFIGLAALSLISAWISIFTGVKIQVLVLVSLPWVVYWGGFLKRLQFSLKNINSLNKQDALFIVSVLFMFFTLSSGQPVFEDTELYHVQSIKWINEYGTVPGLANLYLRYGFYTNWFRLISLFELPFVPSNYLYLNNALCVWFFFFIYYQLKKFSGLHAPTYSKHLRLYYILVLLYMLFEWDLFRVASSSTSYDFVVTVYTLLILHLIMFMILHKDIPRQLHLCLLFFFATLPFFKVSGFLVAVLFLTYVILFKPPIKYILFFTMIGLAGMLSFLIINYVQTGYPFYPYFATHDLQPEWQVPHDMVNKFSKFITIHNRYINQSPPPQAWDTDASFSYMHNWFPYLTMLDKLLLILSALSLPTAPRVLRRLYPDCHFKILLVLLACYCMIAIWLLFSPDPRFSFSTLLFTSMFTIAGLLYNVSKQWMTQTILTLTAGIILFYTASKWITKLPIRNIIQPDAVPVPVYQSVVKNDIPFYIPEKFGGNWNRRCYNTPLPCIYELNPWLQPRGADLIYGFKMTSNPDSEFIKNYNY